MGILKPGETLIAKESDYSSGSIGWFGTGVNDAYDIYLAEDLSKSLILILYMEIQFIFHNAFGDDWTDHDKGVFVSRFKSVINSKWGNKRQIKTLGSGKKVYLDIRFTTYIDGWNTSEHWEIHVKKIKKGSFSESSVNAFTGNVHLDSEDFNPVRKKGGSYQRGVVHEFGHMLGLDDEYEAGSNYADDFNSIMNGGEIIRGRHDEVYIKWVEQVVKKQGIK